MIEKIISGGQTGVGIAALDVAIELGIPHGGWIPKGRITEDGPLPDKYQLQEMPTGSYSKRTEQNAIDSQGTLIISHGRLTGGSAYTLEMAEKHYRPHLHIDLAKLNSFEAAKEVVDWISRNKITTLNVAGPRASEAPAIYDAAVKLLKAVFYMGTIDTKLADPYSPSPFLPQSVDEAVDWLISVMPLAEKTSIANMKEEALPKLHSTLGKYIKDKFGLLIGNAKILNSCQYRLGKANIREEDCSGLIIRELWKKLQQTHVLRAVK